MPTRMSGRCVRWSGDRIVTAVPNGERRRSLDFDWRFRFGDIAGAEDPDLDDSDWRRVDLPHDWSIEGTYSEEHSAGALGAFLPTGVGWYRRVIDMDGGVPDGRRVAVEFDGVYMNSDVWINGVHLGHRPNGYVGFEYDLTPALRPGRNVLAVRADHSRAPSARWYTGSGIYRHVWLTVTADVRVAHWGVHVMTPSVRDESADVLVRATVENTSRHDRDVTVWMEVVEEDDQDRVRHSAQGRLSIPAEGAAVAEKSMVVAEPNRWSPEHPRLYLLRTTVEERGKVVDRYDTPFGIREYRFDPVRGFSLNGVPTKLRGVCQHHDAGPVGAAVPDKVLTRRLRLLKDMGCNAIRVGHNPAAPEFYDLCDRMGFLVIDEAFDGWSKPKAPYDYGLYFDQWWKRDLADLIARDRNHPCVIMWSIGNEVPDKTDEQTRELVDFVHALDPTRPVTCGRGTSGIEDVQGFNGQGGVPGVLESYHDEHPDRVLLLTEEPHTLQTRGFYRTRTWWRDRLRPREEVPNLTESELFFDGSVLYNSSYDNSGVRRSARDSWRNTRDLPYVCGEFRWSGFDYLGESPRWPARTYNYGVIDLCGFPKDHYFFYQSQWTTDPMVHLLPHWTHPGLEGVAIPVWAYTTCDSVELFLNGRSLGTRAPGDDLRCEWSVPYEPGRLHGIGRCGDVDVADAEVRTAASPSAVRLSADVTELAADGRDVSHVTFEVVDADGTRVPRADHTVHFWWRGPTRCLGFDNGDPLDLTEHLDRRRQVFHGLGLGIFGATRAVGDVEVVAGAILGDRYFADSTTVSVSVTSLMLRGRDPLDENRYDIRYTTDGSEPSSRSRRYEHPFRIEDGCSVKATVHVDGERILTMEQLFTRGSPPRVVDMSHGNEEPADRTVPHAPRDPEAVGTWRSEHEEIALRDDGSVVRPPAYGSSPEVIGSWWYDFPHDKFEMPDDAGVGEIWWANGTTAELRLADQQAERLHVRYAGTDVPFDRVVV